MCNKDAHNFAILTCRHRPVTGGRGTIACATSFAFLPRDDSSCVLTTGHPSDVCSLSGRAKLEPVSAQLQDSLRFFRPLKPAAPTVCLTVHLPPRGGDTRFPRSAYITIVNTVGGIWTPVVRQLRTGTLDACNLTTSRTPRGACFDLVVSVGLYSPDGACDSSHTFTIVL